MLKLKFGANANDLHIMQKENLTESKLFQLEVSENKNNRVYAKGYKIAMEGRGTIRATNGGGVKANILCTQLRNNFADDTTPLVRKNSTKPRPLQPFYYALKFSNITSRTLSTNSFSSDFLIAPGSMGLDIMHSIFAGLSLRPL